MRFLSPHMMVRSLVLMVVLASCLLPAAPAVAGDPAVMTPAGFFGVQMRDSLAEQGVLPLAAAAGIAVIRTNLRWDEVEPSDTQPRTYNWVRYDEIIGQATGAGFGLILTIRDNPSWASSTACGPIDKVAPSRLVDFVRAAVNRYSKPPYNVRLWELYNEPDNNHADMPQQGGCWGQHAAAYAALLAQMQPAIKAADANSKLVLGGLAFDLFEGIDEGGIFNDKFLTQLLASPGGSSFDIMNFHYYKAFAWRWNQYGKDVIGKATYIRTQLAAKGLTRPVMVTEIGDPSAGPASDGQNYSEAASSTYLLQAYARGLAAGLHSMTWFEMADSSVEPRKYGLLTEDGVPKQAYRAYRTLTRELGGASYARTTSGGGLETYAFDAGDRQKLLSWSSDSLTHTLSITATLAYRVDRLGDRTIVRDGSAADGDASAGRVGVAVGAEPVYVYPFVSADVQRQSWLPSITRRH
jgi:hypothetical protein